MGLKEYIFGFDAEKRAAKFLKKSGFEILGQNFHSRFGEIDIIAKKGEILHFIEVKATSGDYMAAERVTSAKIAKILKSIDYYLMKNGLNLDFQVDLIVVNNNKIELLENISL